MSLIEQLKKHEGFRGCPYFCSEGYLTIGYGRNLETNPFTEVEAEQWLEQELKKISKQAVFLPYYSKLSQPRRAVILNMIYNLGFDRFRGFKKMSRALKKGDYEKAAIEMLDSKWAEQVKGRAKELAEQMRSGVYQ